MSRNIGTGFWVVVALIAAMSVAVLIEAVLRTSSGLVARALRRWKAIATPFSAADDVKRVRA